MSSTSSVLDYENLQDLRLALVGKTGAGKSATGNTLLGKKVFTSKASSAGVTRECQKETGEFEGQTLSVVDTPDLFDIEMTEEEVTTEVKKCISFCAPGPHVFLVVIQSNRFTDEEQKTVKLIQKLFGEKAAEYTIALITHGDNLEYDGVTVETFISENTDFHNFISQCQGGYHVFNNRQTDPGQVRELLKKIHLMVERNGGSYFTNEMLEEAERAIREEMERLLKEDRQLKQEEARKQAERDNNFIKKVIIGLMTSGAAGGAAVGAAVGSMLGPVGVGVGAAVGVVVGATVGAAVGAKAGGAVADYCVSQ